MEPWYSLYLRVFGLAYLMVEILLVPVNLILIITTSVNFDQYLSSPCGETNFINHIQSCIDVQISAWLQIVQLLIGVGMLSIVVILNCIIDARKVYLIVIKLSPRLKCFIVVSMYILLTSWVLDVFALVQTFKKEFNVNKTEYIKIQESSLCCGIQSYINDMIPNTTTHVHLNLLTTLMFKSNKLSENNRGLCCCYNPNHIISYTNLQVYNGLYFGLRILVWCSCNIYGRFSAEWENIFLEVENIENPNPPPPYHDQIGHNLFGPVNIPSSPTCVGGQCRTPNNTQDLNINQLFVNGADMFSKYSNINAVSCVKIHTCNPLELILCSEKIDSKMHVSKDMSLELDGTLIECHVNSAGNQIKLPQSHSGIPSEVFP